MISNLSYKKFFFLVLTTGLIYILFLILLKYVFLYNPHFLELISGWLLSSVNILIGVRILENALTKSNKRFMVISFGSITVRMFATIIIFLILILLFKFERVSLVFSVFGFYFIYLLFEIIYLVSLSKKLNIQIK